MLTITSFITYISILMKILQSSANHDKIDFIIAWPEILDVPAMMNCRPVLACSSRKAATSAKV